LYTKNIFSQFKYTAFTNLKKHVIFEEVRAAMMGFVVDEVKLLGAFLSVTQFHSLITVSTYIFALHIWV
jgi:hypothetical protein